MGLTAEYYYSCNKQLVERKEQLCEVGKGIVEKISDHERKCLEADEKVFHDIFKEA